MTEIPQIHTSCRDCIFAQYEGKTQVGCSFRNRTEEFKKSGQLIEARDDEREFFVVANRLCLAFRNQKYQDSFKPENQKKGEPVKAVRPGSTLQDVVRYEIASKIDYIILVNETTNLDQLEGTIRTVLRRTLRPNSIILASNQDKWRIYKLITLMERVAERHTWFIANLLRRNDDGSLLPDEVAVDEAVHKCTGHFYVQMNAGTSLHRTFGQQLDEHITDKLQQIAVLEPDSVPAQVVHVAFHNFVSGNKPISVKRPQDEVPVTLFSLGNKARFYQEVQSIEGMVRKVSEVCSK